MRWPAFLLLFALAWLLVGADDAPLDVQAARVEYDRKSGVVRFEGDVQAVQGALTLRCDRLLAHYAEGGALTALDAEGAVKVTAEGWTASAGRAAWRREAGTLELTDRPVVVRGEDRLEGARIVFWPDAGKLVVEQARGRLRAPRLDARLQAP